ncbi:protein RALF-like 27 [Coffea eugenioides]|uniref:protein RALF-like 27 n=1 Tax=Coffea eugenioides TaxID=49369 RepID=UPI000F60B33B|nr:protein RALF-like 27 [Coffea eugenioides]
MSFSLKRKKNTGLLFLVLFLILWGDLAGASVSSPIKGAGLPCNGTFSECFLDGSMESEGEEFLRPYAAPGRWLQSQQQNTIGYNSLQRKPVCSAAQYSNCIVQVNSVNGRCNDYNRCNRKNPN